MLGTIFTMLGDERTLDTLVTILFKNFVIPCTFQKRTGSENTKQ